MRWLQSTSYIFISGMVLKDWKRVCSNGNWKATKRPTNWWHCLRPRQELSSKVPNGSLSAQSCFIDVLEREPNSISQDGGVQVLTVHVTAAREDGQPGSNRSHALHTEAALRWTGPELTWRSRVTAEGAERLLGAQLAGCHPHRHRQSVFRRDSQGTSGWQKAGGG